MRPPEANGQSYLSKTPRSSQRRMRFAYTKRKLTTYDSPKRKRTKKKKKEMGEKK